MRKAVILSSLVVFGLALMCVSTSAASYTDRGDRGDRGAISRDRDGDRNFNDDFPYPRREDATSIDRVKEGQPPDDHGYYRAQKYLRDHR